jgi:hypothetical protein
MLYGLEFKRRTIDGEPYFTIKPHGFNAMHVAIAIVVIAFAWIACEITDVPDVKPTVNVGRFIR